MAELISTISSDYNEIDLEVNKGKHLGKFKHMWKLTAQ